MFVDGVTPQPCSTGGTSRGNSSVRPITSASSPAHQPFRPADDAIPLEGGAGVDLVGLDVKMPQDSLVRLVRVVVELLRDEGAGRAARIVAPDFGEDGAERRRQLDERVVLRRREVVLPKLL